MKNTIRLIIIFVLFIIGTLVYIALSNYKKKIEDRDKNSVRKFGVAFLELLDIVLIFLSFVIVLPLGYGGSLQQKTDELIDYISNGIVELVQNKTTMPSIFKIISLTSPTPHTIAKSTLSAINGTVKNHTLTPEPATQPTQKQTVPPTSEPTPQPTPEPTPEPTPQPTPVSTSTPMPDSSSVNEGQNPLEGNALITYVNQYRSNAGVSELIWDSNLEQTAQNIATMFATGGYTEVDSSIMFIGRQCNGAKNAQRAVSDWMTGNAYIPSESENLLNAGYTQMGGALYYLSNGNEYGYHYFWVICLQ